MRKYFLLSAVSLLAATNVNAYTYATTTFNTKANILITDTIECTQDLDFGTIMVQRDGEFSSTASIVAYDEEIGVKVEDISGVSVQQTGGHVAKCNFGSGTFIDEETFNQLTINIDWVDSENSINETQHDVSVKFSDPIYANGGFTIGGRLEIKRTLDTNHTDLSFPVSVIRQ